MNVYINRDTYQVVSEARFEEIIEESVDERIEASPDFWDDCLEDAADAEYSFPADLFFDAQMNGWSYVEQRITGIARDIATDRMRETIEERWFEKYVQEAENV